jgi:hypothetical protein
MASVLLPAIILNNSTHEKIKKMGGSSCCASFHDLI